MSFFNSRSPADLPPVAANEMIRQAADALAAFTAAQVYAHTINLEPAERLHADEAIDAARQTVVGALRRLEVETGIRRTLAGSWVEAWPTTNGAAQRRRAHLEDRGHLVRVDWRAGNAVLTYQAAAPEPLVTGVDRARRRAAAEVTR